MLKAIFSAYYTVNIIFRMLYNMAYYWELRKKKHL